MSRLHERIDSATAKQVIEVRLVRGDGANIPIHRVMQYWSLDGQLPAEHDTLEVSS